MSTTPEHAILPAEIASKNSPENAPLRESPTQEALESAPIVEVMFGKANTPFRESLVKMPRKPRNAEWRSREYLTHAEVEKLIKGAESVGRHGHRDGTLILVAYRHALRVSELVTLRWDQIDLAQGLMHINRLKNGTPSTHPIRGPELRALRRLQRDYPGCTYVFNGGAQDSINRLGGQKNRCAGWSCCGHRFSCSPPHAAARRRF